MSMIGCGECPQAYGGCTCQCHRVPGVKHVVACCYPSSGLITPEGELAILDVIQKNGTAIREAIEDGSPPVPEEIDYEVTVAEGKYTYQRLRGGGQRCLRYGEPWRDLTGDGMVLALVQRIEELTEILTQAGIYYDE